MISVFLSSNGFLSFMYLGPKCKQKNRYVARIKISGPGDEDSNHGFVRGSTKESKLLSAYVNS